MAGAIGRSHKSSGFSIYIKIHSMSIGIAGIAV